MESTRIMSDDNSTTTTTEPQGGSQSKPPWGENFDAEKAWKLIENLREDNKRRTSSEVEELRKQITDLQPLADEAKRTKDASKTEMQRLTERIEAAEKRAADAEKRVHESDVQSLRSKIESMAAKSFADPEDAATFLDPKKYLQDSGNYDPKAIEADLEDLLKRKPHLAREQSRTPRTPAPDRSQGSSGSRTTPTAPRDVFAGFIQQHLGRSSAG